MNLWNGAWYLAGHEIKRERWGFVLTLFFIAYFVLFTAPSYQEALIDREEKVFVWVIDFLNIAMLPVLGFCMNRANLNFCKNDYYTQKLQQWRTLPITLKQIVMGRLIQYWIILTSVFIIYFSMLYAYIALMGTEGLSLTTFVLYALTWYGYSMVVGVSYIYWELGTTGKVYFIISCLYIIGYFMLTILLLILLKSSISVSVINALEEGQWWIPVIAVALGLSSIAAGTKLIENRLRKRDLSK